MPRALSFLIFFGIFSTVLGSVHYYLWARLVRDTALGAPAHDVATLLIGVLFLTQPLGLALLARGPRRLKPLVSVTFIWLGLLFLTLSATAASEVLRLGALALQALAPSAELFDSEHQLTLRRLLAGAVVLLAGSLGAMALSGGTRVRVRKLNIQLARLPRAAHGTTIVQWSDVHIGPTLGRPFIEELVERTNRLNADVIAITGDLVDGPVAELRRHIEPLRGLRSRCGVFFVTGNHEYYSGVDEWCVELSRLGIRVLRNEHVPIGDAGNGFDLAGIDDYQGSRYGRGHGPNLEKALLGRDPTRELVLLAHQPRAIREAEQRGVGLQLSGHTHGGQIWPWNFLVRLQQPIISGLERVGGTLIYVSNGTGYWGPPMRLGAPAEITHITLLAPT